MRAVQERNSGQTTTHQQPEPLAARSKLSPFRDRPIDQPRNWQHHRHNPHGGGVLATAVWPSDFV